MSSLNSDKLDKSLPSFLRRGSIFLIICLFALLAFFEFSDFVQSGRNYIARETYDASGLSCASILEARPWYGKINHWFFAWIVFVPVLVFSAFVTVSTGLRRLLILLAAVVCYAFMNLAVYLQSDIRNAPFSQDVYNSSPADGWRMDCVNTADGFSLVLALTLAWIPAFLYTVFWLRICEVYAGRIGAPVEKTDLISRIFYIAAKVYIVLLVLVVAVVACKNLAGFYPIPKEIAVILYYVILRPLFIPFEIFMY